MKRISCLTILVIIASAFLMACGKKEEEVNTKDISAFSDKQVIEYLEDKGYTFSAMQSIREDATKYIYISNKNNGIIIQKYDNHLIGTHYVWKNEDINSEWCDIRIDYENNTAEKEKQYSEYEKWCKKLGISTMQLTDAIDYYQSNVKEYEKF